MTVADFLRSMVTIGAPPTAFSVASNSQSRLQLEGNAVHSRTVSIIGDTFVPPDPIQITRKMVLTEPYLCRSVFDISDTA
jgi:hypothetical protein